MHINPKQLTDQTIANSFFIITLLFCLLKHSLECFYRTTGDMLELYIGENSITIPSPLYYTVPSRKTAKYFAGL